MEELDSRLLKAISNALVQCEENSDLVITTSVVNKISDVIAEKVKEEYSGGIISPEETLGVATLIFHAIENKKFFDWEMPTLCGYSAEEFDTIARKLRGSVGI